jgi:hypothetical protein
LALRPPQVVKEALYVVAMWGWLGEAGLVSMVARCASPAAPTAAQSSQTLCCGPFPCVPRAAAGCAMDGAGSLALAWGLQLQPTFAPLWEAHSVSRFWGQVWNLAASSAVRCSVYELILEGCWVRPRPVPGAQQSSRAEQAPLHRTRQAKDGRPAWAALALCVSCLVSGLVHEAIVWYISGASVKGAWLAFFAVQVRCVAWGVRRRCVGRGVLGAGCDIGCGGGLTEACCAHHLLVACRPIGYESHCRAQ